MSILVLRDFCHFVLRPGSDIYLGRLHFLRGPCQSHHCPAADRGRAGHSGAVSAPFSAAVRRFRPPGSGTHHTLSGAGASDVTDSLAEYL